MENHWQQVKQAPLGACEVSVGINDRQYQEWISPETLIRIDERKTLKNKLNNSRIRAVKQTVWEAYTRTNRKVKRSARRDKRNFVAKLTAEGEKAAGQNNIKALYDNIQLLTRKYQKGSHPIKDKEGKTLKIQQEQLADGWSTSHT